MQFGPTPYPVTEYVLAYFVTFLYKEGLAPSSVKSYLSAVRHAQIATGMGDPHLGEMPQLEYFIKGIYTQAITRTVAVSSSHYPPRTTLSQNIPGEMISHFDGAMLWAAAYMHFLASLDVVRLWFHVTPHLMQLST